MRAYILAGGKSSRFGSDKALARVHEHFLIQQVADAAAAVPAHVTVIADVPDKYKALELETIADLRPGLGPVGGLMTALEVAPENSHFLLLSCDLVGLQTNWLRALLHAAPSAEVVLFDAEPMQFLLGRYHTSLKDGVHALFESEAGEGDARQKSRSMRRLISTLEPLLLPSPGDWSRLVNVNRPADLPGGTVP